MSKNKTKSNDVRINEFLKTTPLASIYLIEALKFYNNVATDEQIDKDFTGNFIFSSTNWKELRDESKKIYEE